MTNFQIELDHDPNALGNRERIVNEFRKELKMVERSSYFYTEHKTFEGRLINVPWKFDNKDILIKPLNRILLFDKIIRSSFSKTIKQ